MTYVSVHLDEDVQIERIVTIHYFEYRNDFHFSGEAHNFWEFQCVDKGEVEVLADHQIHILKRGQIIFHRPNEFHNLNANGKSAPNIVVVAFECNSPAMEFFNHKILDINDQERNLLAMIVAEARKCFSTPLDDPYLEKMEKKPETPLGSQQLIKIYLQQMLIYMIRRHTAPQLIMPLTSFANLKYNSATYNKIIFYLEEHIREYVSIEDICRENLIGRSQLQKMFREQHNCGVIDFFSQMKIEFAKQLIRENHMNFTQISDFLGYSSIHYFSRQFKKITGMTPSEYASSIKALADRK